MNINNINSQSFGKLYVKRELGAILTPTQLQVRNDVLFPNHRYNEKNISKLYGIDVYDKKQKQNKDILQILVEKLENQGKDVFVILRKNNNVIAEIRNRHMGNIGTKRFGKCINQKCILRENIEAPSVPEVVFNKLCDFIEENIQPEQ